MGKKPTVREIAYSYAKDNAKYCGSLSATIDFLQAAWLDGRKSAMSARRPAPAKKRKVKDAK